MKTFADFSDAYDYCRECNRPVTVLVNDERWKLFPSGRGEILREREHPVTREGRLRAETGIYSDDL